MRLIVSIVFLVWLVLAALSARMFTGPIEVELKERARRALDARGLEMVQVEFDHLDARLSGNVPVPEMRSMAAAVVGELEVVRLRENRITFGRDPAPSLEFVAGDPVRVSGVIGRGQEWVTQSLGRGFDPAGIEVARRADILFIDRLIPLAEQFFEQVDGGRLQLDGHRLVMEGELPNRLAKWQLIDQAMGMAVNIDVVDRLKVRSPSPFAIHLQTEGDRLRLRGVVRDEASLLAVGGGSPAADCTAVSLDPRVGAPAWLWRVAAPIAACSRMAISASFDLSPEKLSVSATFANRFWLEAAERQLRVALPGRPILELDLQVALPAVALEGAPAATPPERPLPIGLFVAGDRLRVEGRVRKREDRDAIISRLEFARPDLMIQNALQLDPRVRRLPVVQPALPDFFAFAVSGISEFGSLELGATRWSFNADSRDPQFMRRAELVGAGIEQYCQIPFDLDLRLEDGEPQRGLELALADYAIYFREGGAQIVPGQGEKIASLAGLITGLAGKQEIMLTGFDRGDGRLGLQRARAVRRALQQVASGPSTRFRVCAAEAQPEPDWRGDRVSVGLRPAPDGV